MSQAFNMIIDTNSNVFVDTQVVGHREHERVAFLNECLAKTKGVAGTYRVEVSGDSIIQLVRDGRITYTTEDPWYSSKINGVLASDISTKGYQHELRSGFAHTVVFER